MAQRLKTYTLGCKVNQYETEYVRQALLSGGYRDAGDDEPADVCVVNTCTVTGEGDAKSRQVIRRLARHNPHARIVVMGCYATRAPEELASLPGVVDVVTDKRELPALVERLGVLQAPRGLSRFGTRHRAYLKVQEGCLLRCSYCIIPQVRPHVISRPPVEILEEVARLVDNGYRELVLTGVHLGHYGVEHNRGKAKADWLRLSHLVRQIALREGDFRVRLSSLEATEMTRELVEVLAEFPHKICPHVHVCLQSGSDRILRAMRRRWGVRRLLDCCRSVQQRLSRPALTTDVIVGFPGETEEDFLATCRAIREIGFCKVHIFPFSPRAGTPAATMPGSVAAEVKAARGRRLAELAAEVRRDYLNQLVGQPLHVLVESPVSGDAERWIGTSCRYMPVELTAGTTSQGQIVPCVPTAHDGGRLLA
jgi:threonylcarbamoyladenosine tRNA methylthiotransferase MtaB